MVGFFVPTPIQWNAVHLETPVHDVDLSIT